MEEVQKRQIAYKVLIKDILNSQYYKEEGWTPNYILTEDNRKISRANVIATIISKSQESEQFQYVIIDDGSGEIFLRNFGEVDIFRSLNIGDVILVIGKVREFSNDKYIIPEIIRHIDKNWVLVRNAELYNEAVSSEPETSPKVSKEYQEDIEVISDSPYAKILNLIRKNDSGEGAIVDDVIKESGDSECEKIIENLLLKGEIFEIKPGMVKVLE